MNFLQKFGFLVFISLIIPQFFILKYNSQNLLRSIYSEYDVEVDKHFYFIGEKHIFQVGDSSYIYKPQYSTCGRYKFENKATGEITQKFLELNFVNNSLRELKERDAFECIKFEEEMSPSFMNRFQLNMYLYMRTLRSFF